MMVPALAANTYEAEALKLQAINVFAGGPEDLKLDEGVTRIQGLTFAIRAAGKDAEALAMEDAEVDAILADWTDADSIPAWGRKYAAYAIKNSITVGLSSTEKIFGAMNPISGTSFLVFFMKSGMGYASVTTADVVDAAVTAGILTAGQAVTFAFGAKEALIRDDAAGILFGAFTTGVNADGTKLIDAYIASGATTAADAAAAGFTSSSTLAVESITANTAKSFLVKFNKAVTDDDKVTFSVKRLSSDVAVTATWNEAKTEATLASASNLAEATFTVAVLKDSAEIAKEDIAITAQKVAKIEFTSNSVSVELLETNSVRKGYVTYKVYDQYNNDITTSYLANNMTFQTGTGSAVGKDGLITITPATNLPLLQFPQISVIAYDTTSGVSATATLPTSTSAGTLSNFTLGSTDALNLSEGDVTSVFYLPYTALDISGNETKDYNLVKSGLIFAKENSTELVVSLPSYVKAQIVQDPANPKNAAVEVKVQYSTDALAMDMPVTITAMTYSGKTSSVQTTIAKSKDIDNIILIAPAETVAAQEKPEIKFEAYDQYGNKITKYNDVYGSDVNNRKLSISGFTVEKKVNGDAKFIMDNKPEGVATLSAVVSRTGKMSTLNISVQKTAQPARIVVEPKDIVNAMENGAYQNIKLGDQIVVYDQYDRKMSNDAINDNFGTGANKFYIDIANVTGKVKLGAEANNSTGKFEAKDATEKVTGVLDNPEIGDSDTIKFELKKNIGVEGNFTDDLLLSAVSVAFSVVPTKDITDYTINTFDKPIFASIGSSFFPGSGDTSDTAQERAYAAEIKVYGKTGSGTKVLLADGPVLGADVENTADFNIISGGRNYDSIKVSANSLANNRTSAETVATVTLFHNNTVTALTTNISSSSTVPTVKNIVSKGTSNDRITTTAANLEVNDYVVKYTEAGDETTDETNRGAFYFEIEDSYGKKAMIPTKFYVNRVSGNGTLAIDDNGKVTTVAGTGVFIVSAVTNNGYVCTVEVTINE
jgi:hypothetical protein